MNQAKLDHIPILDLSNTFNPNNSDLYIAQIEPSKKGGEIIASGIADIIKHHTPSSKSMIYSRKDSDATFIASENQGIGSWPGGWCVTYPTSS